jgi:hypothetical protein
MCDFVETLADPYKGMIPLPLPSLTYQEQGFSCHLTNTTSNRQELFLKGKCIKQSFPTIITE